ncbi:TRAP transporter permease [Bacillus sp. Marseille-P3661]|uniref:TRAP transporter permease n=1 Tax=Bacillus sp. Marseille-P3661 TaxID=1936234 RepID=UPI000C816F47|nr:TRAP transporter fused permease subunit [Bacillus sp. Marseille-P3661]
MKKYINLFSIIAIGWALFQLYLAGVGPLDALLQRAIHTGFALALCFAIISEAEKKKGVLKLAVDYVLVFLSILTTIYVIYDYKRIASRMFFVSELQPLDYFFGIVLVLLVLEASRRIAGLALTVLAAMFLIYAFAGPYMPGLLEHRGFSFKQVVDIMFLSTDGILGAPVAASVNFVFYFVLFAVFLEQSGGGKLFIDIAFKLTGKAKGGPAKAAVLASGGMGSISGSAVGNVVSTGVLTIPLMQKVGFSPKFAASVEALASTGGQLLPPIMGAAAFIVANTIGMPYSEFILAALIPAILFYVAVFSMVHMQTNKLGLKSEDSDVKAERLKDIIRRLPLLIPLVILVYFIFSGATLQKAAFWAIISVVVLSAFRKSTRFKISDILDCFIKGAQQSLQVAIPCAVAGIVVGVVLHTGLGLKLTSIIMTWSFGNVFLSVLLVAICCIILGMGMPTVSAYIMASVLLATALLDFGFELIAVHMFLLYFAVFSMITPPVALSAYAAASIAKTNAHKTGMYAFYLGIPAFLIAFAFLFNPALLLIGTPFEITSAIIMTLIGVIMLSAAVIGNFMGSVDTPVRILALISSISLVINNNLSDIIGLVLVGIIIIVQLNTKRKNKFDYSEGKQSAI